MFRLLEQPDEQLRIIFPADTEFYGIYVWISNISEVKQYRLIQSRKLLQ